VVKGFKYLGAHDRVHRAVNPGSEDVVDLTCGHFVLVLKIIREELVSIMDGTPVKQGPDLNGYKDYVCEFLRLKEWLPKHSHSENGMKLCDGGDPNHAFFDLEYLPAAKPINLTGMGAGTDDVEAPPPVGMEAGGDGDHAKFSGVGEREGGAVGRGDPWEGGVDVIGVGSGGEGAVRTPTVVEAARSAPAAPAPMVEVPAAAVPVAEAHVAAAPVAAAPEAAAVHVLAPAEAAQSPLPARARAAAIVAAAQAQAGALLALEDDDGLL